MSTEQKIARKRDRDGMIRRCEAQLRAVRIRVFDYEDMGKGAKAERVIARLKARLAPVWEARSHAAMEPKLSNYGM